MATRHQQTSGKQSATVVLRPKHGEKIMFEANKEGVKLMLQKLAVVD